MAPWYHDWEIQSYLDEHINTRMDARHFWYMTSVSSRTKYAVVAQNLVKPEHAQQQ